MLSWPLAVSTPNKIGSTLFAEKLLPTAVFRIPLDAVLVVSVLCNTSMLWLVRLQLFPLYLSASTVELSSASNLQRQVVRCCERTLIIRQKKKEATYFSASRVVRLPHSSRFRSTYSCRIETFRESQRASLLCGAMLSCRE